MDWSAVPKAPQGEAQTASHVLEIEGRNSVSAEKSNSSPLSRDAPGTAGIEAEDEARVIYHHFTLENETKRVLPSLIESRNDERAAD